MVAVLTGSGLGLESSSRNILGLQGQVGSALLGRGAENVYVNAATGNLVIQNDDEFIAGQGPDISVVRTYNSLGLLNDDNGDNWLPGLTRTVNGLTGTLNTAGSSVTRTNWDGSTAVYTWDSTRSAYVSTAGSGAYDTITYSAGVWTWRDGNSRITESYDEANGGRITSSADTDGNSLAYTYTGGRLTRITNANGEYTELVYNAAGNLDRLTSSLPNAGVTRVLYTYDSLNRLQSVAVDHSIYDGSVADGNAYVTTYSYEGNSKRIASISQTDGSLLQITYEQDSTDPTLYRVKTLAETVAAGTTRTTTFTYSSGSTSIQDPLGNVTVLTYNANGELRYIQVPPAKTGDSPQITEFVYDSLGNVTAIIDASMNSVGNEYDSNGNLTRSINSQQLEVTRRYGADNQLLAETRYLIPDPDFGGPLTASGAVTSHFVYDAELHLRFVIGAEGDVIEYRYNSVGQRVSEIRYPGHNYPGLADNQDVSLATMEAWVAAISDKSSSVRTDTAYDFRGNVSTVTSYTVLDSAGEGQLTGDYSRTTYVYNQDGTLYKRFTNASPNEEIFAYDGLSRITWKQDLSGYATAITYIDKHSTTTVTLADGATKVSTYNKVGELIAYTEAASPNLIPNALFANDKEGWSAGNAQRVAGSTTDPLPFLMQTTVDYGGAESIDAITLPAGSTFEIAATAKASGANQFFKIGIWWSDANGVMIGESAFMAQPADVNFKRYEYQATRPAGAVTAKIFVSTSAGVKFGGLHFGVSNAEAADLNVTSYRYDAAGNLRIERDATGRVVHHLYDNVGRKVADISADGAVIEYRYDASDRLVATVAYQNKLTAANLAGLVNSDGSPASITIDAIRPAEHSNDSWEWRIYDRANRLLQTLDRTGAATSYEYDGASQLTKVTRHANYYPSSWLEQYEDTPPTIPYNVPAHSADQIARNYYDKQGRLVGTLDGAGGLTEIVYDKAGQKIRTIVYATAATDHTASFSDLKTQVGTTAADRRTDFVYDTRGLLRYRIDSLSATQAKPTEFVYNANGQLIRSVEYAGYISPGSSYTLANVATKLSQANLTGNANNRVTRTVYDNAGRVRFTIDAVGSVVRYDYDQVGQVTTKIAYSTYYTGSGDPTNATMESWAFNQPAPTPYTRTLYDAMGRVVYEVDAESYVTEFKRDAAGRVTSRIVYADKYAVNTATTRAQLAAMIGTLPTSAAVTAYSYDAAGRMTDVTFAQGSAEATTTHYVYDALGQATEVTVAYGTADAATTLNVYDAAGRVISTTRGYQTSEASTVSYEYDAAGNLTKIIDGRTYATVRIYDALRRLVTEKVPIDATITADTHRQYNALGDLVKLTDPNGNSTHYYYDNLGRMELEIDAETYATKTSYTVFGQVESVTRVMAASTGTYNVNTRPTINTDAAKDHLTQFQYDKAGRLTRVTDAQGHYEEYTLDALGNRWQVRNKLGGITTNEFDRRGLLTKETLPIESRDWTGALVASAVSNTFEYDARGNRTKMIEAAGLGEARTTNYEYDKLDRLKKTIGNTVTILSEDLSTQTAVTPTEEIRYDKRGNVIETIDAAGGRTLYYYDDLNRKIGEVNAVGEYKRWEYDRNGNITKAVSLDRITLPVTAGGSLPPASSENYRETAYEYDRANRLIKTTALINPWNNMLTGEFNGTSYVTSTGSVSTLMEYDRNGNLIKETDPKGNFSIYYYDKLGRKTGQVDKETYLTKWFRDAEGNVTQEIRYKNRGVGAINTGSFPAVAADAALDRVTNFTYDKNGRRLTEERINLTVSTVSATGVLSTSVNQTSIVKYEYNGLGQVTRKEEATGDFFTYTYDAMGRQTQIASSAFTGHTGASVQKTNIIYYNGLNNITRTVENNSLVTTYVYSAGGRLDKMTVLGAGGQTAAMASADNFETSYQYDAAGRVRLQSYVRLKSNGSKVTEGVAFKYDLLGRVTWQSMAIKNGTTWSTSGLDFTQTQYGHYGEVTAKGVRDMWQETFEYDRAGRLIRTTAGDGVYKLFYYDKAGNRTLTITSEGTFIGYDTPEQALARFTGGITSFTDGVTATIEVVDKRGQVVEVREPQRELTQTQLNGTSARATLLRSRTYNAFGEVTSETDAKGNASGAVADNTTLFTYNTMGRLIKKEAPLVSWTAENGAQANARPPEEYYYDVSGRLVAVKDANGFVTKRTLLAHTGYGGEEAKVLKEFRPDTGVMETKYDVSGNARTLINELGIAEHRAYDVMGRLTHQQLPARPAGSPGNPSGAAVNLTNYYHYDGLGQRIQHWNYQFGSSFIESTDYDVQGRVVSTTDFEGTATTYTYSWVNMNNAGLGNYGAWVKTTFHPAGKTLVEKFGYFGHLLEKKDLGDHTFTYTYDLAGRLVAQGGQEYVAYTSFNTGLVAKSEIGGAGGIATTFEYDANGNRTREQMSNGNKNSTASYDALNRMVTYTDTGPNGAAPTSVVWEYDRVGNIRHVNATFRKISGNGYESTDTVQDLWYRYDSLNRVVLAMGKFNGTRGSGSISRGYTGVDITYNVAGQRETETRTLSLPVYSGQGTLQGYVDCDMRSWHAYTTDGHLVETKTSNPSTSSPTAPATPPANAQVKTWLRDQMGRVVTFIDGSSTTNTTYNKRSQVLTTSTVSGTTSTTATYHYNLETTAGNYNGAYQGVVTHMRTGNRDTRYSYEWWDEAKQKVVTTKPDYNQSTTWTSTYSYDSGGRVTQVAIADGQPRTVTFLTDAEGRVIQRKDGTKPTDLYYYMAAETIGDVSATAHSSAGPQHQFYGDFDQNYRPVSSGSADAPVTYTVKSGDTLRTVAAAVWGDGGLWYLIAEANGLTGSETLAAGQVLTIPNHVINARNTSETFKPYNPNEAQGFNEPTKYAPIQMQPAPPKKKKGGGLFGFLGKIILAAVAIAVTVALPHVSAVFSGFWGNVLGAVVASTVSQGVGIATGVQDKFSFKSVALSALTAGVAKGLDGIKGFDQLSVGGSKFATEMVKGAITSALTQGLAVATGLQNQFDWAGVAAAGLGQGFGRGTGIRTGTLGGRILSTAADAAGGAAARSLIEGTSFGDNLIAVLPSVIGRSIGNEIGVAISEASARVHERRQIGRLRSIYGDRFSDEQLQTGSRLLTAGDWANGDPLGAAFNNLRSDSGNQLDFADVIAVATSRDPNEFSSAQREAAVARYFKVIDAPLGTAERVNDLYRGFGVYEGASSGRPSPAYSPELAGEILVTGDRSKGFVFGSLGDPALIGVGKASQYIASQIQENPWLEYGLIGLEIAAGPVKFAVQSAIMASPVGGMIEKAVGGAVDYVAGMYTAKEYTPGQAFLAGVGALTLVGLAAFTAAKVISLVRGLGGSAAKSATPEVIQLSKARFGHTFTRHGQDATDFLVKRAAGSGMPQGQFLDDQAAARFILENVGKTKGGPVSLPVPKGLPVRVIMPDGSFASPTTIRLVPGGKGVKTAYPEL